MQSTLSVPTDNIYKFYALFGLIIMVTTAVMFAVRHQHYNRLAFERHIPIKTLETKGPLTREEQLRLSLLQDKAEIASADKNLELGVYFFCFFVFGFVFTTYGFIGWHTKIQPREDKFLDLQIEKLELENRQAKRQRYKAPFPQVKK
ncbi:hypothetical protein [Idiomarina sp.]|uniref:hypothetical protein n=1 Tax=Idiomarina sp. TaxID=1874361 RepID=UPI003A90B618